MTLADRIRARIDASGPNEKNELLVLAAQEIDRLRIALQEACELRAALCRNGDDDEPPTDPSTYDRALKRWIFAMNGNGRE
jgi:hypothetical protein